MAWIRTRIVGGGRPGTVAVITAAAGTVVGYHGGVAVAVADTTVVAEADSTAGCGHGGGGHRYRSTANSGKATPQWAFICWGGIGLG